MPSFCVLTSMALILKPNCSLLYLHSNELDKFILNILKTHTHKMSHMNLSCPC